MFRRYRMQRKLNCLILVGTLAHESIKLAKCVLQIGHRFVPQMLVKPSNIGAANDQMFLPGLFPEVEAASPRTNRSINAAANRAKPCSAQRSS